jgi:hypothetical protein
MLALMQSAGLPYVVHEYFHACFEPMYFADVESSLAAHGFSFVGGVPLHLNVRELATPPQVRKVAEETTSRTEFEMLKDFVTNEFFRSDVYVKGKVDRTEAEMRFYFESTPFGTMAQPGQVKRDAKLGSYTLDYKGPVYDALVPALADGPVTAMQLAQRKELVHLGQARIGDCLKNLVLGGQVVPMRALSVSSSKGPWRIRLPYNEAALEDAVFGERPLVLACPATGAGMHLSLLELMALHQLVHSGDDDSGPWLARIATKREFPIAVGERKIKDVHELGRILPRELEKLRSNVPKLIELGILEPAS